MKEHQSRLLRKRGVSRDGKNICVRSICR